MIISILYTIYDRWPFRSHCSTSTAHTWLCRALNQRFIGIECDNINDVS